MDDWLRSLVLTSGLVWPVVAWLLLGIGVGNRLAVWVDAEADVTSYRAARRSCPKCGAARGWWSRFLLIGGNLKARCGECGQPFRSATLIELCTATLFAGLWYAIARAGVQNVPEVGSGDWQHWRILYHVTLVALLITATATDFVDYFIPDSVTLAGMVIGVGGATLSGNLHLVPLWIDWNQAIPGIQGGYIPDWIRAHDHLHGFAWSLAGLVAGGGLTWLMRWISSTLLGQEAMGFGDVTLMAMIGSFLGWQPTIFVFALAPLCGIVIGLVVLLATGRTFVAFGPYLSAAAILVVFNWKRLWLPTRDIFGHPPTLLLLAGVSFGALIVLLAGIRMYRMIPVKTDRN